MPRARSVHLSHWLSAYADGSRTASLCTCHGDTYSARWDGRAWSHGWQAIKQNSDTKMFFGAPMQTLVNLGLLDLPALSWLLLSAEACAIRRWSSKRGLKGFLTVVWLRWRHWRFHVTQCGTTIKHVQEPGGIHLTLLMRLFKKPRSLFRCRLVTLSLMCWHVTPVSGLLFLRHVNFCPP